MASPLRSMLLVLITAASVTTVALTGTAAASTGCDLYASPSGSDAGSGSLSSPLATVTALDYKLAPGQTGCLEGGTYGSIHTTHYLGNSGTANGQITITAAPGQTATVVGLVELEGSYATLSGLEIDGSNDRYDAERTGTTCPYPVSNGLEIDGHNDIFQDNDYYQSIPSLRGNGIGIGWNGQADNTIIRNNRIHDLGQCQAYDQMIYLAHGNGVQIYDNWLWNDPHGWGIQIYPAAANAHVYDNVIDAAGSGIVLGGSTTVANNTIDHNIILNSTGLPNAGLTQGVGISTCCGLGTGNTFTDNDVYNNPGGIANTTGITLTANTTTNPQLANPTTHDYRPASASPLTTGWSLWDGGLGSLLTAAVTTTTTPTVTTTTTTPVTSSPPPVATTTPVTTTPSVSPAPVTTTPSKAVPKPSTSHRPAPKSRPSARTARTARIAYAAHAAAVHRRRRAAKRHRRRPPRSARRR